MHKIYTASVNLTNSIYENCQTITQVDLMQTPWVNNSMVNAFQNCKNLHTVTNINTNVNNLSCVFNNCMHLINAPTIPANVTNMYQAFSRCSNLINIPAFPPNLIELAGAFSWCSSIVTVPTIPNSVRNLNDGFHDCIALTTVPSLTNLNCAALTQTFLNCKSLTTQPILPEKATYLYRTFLGCSNLTTINIQQNVYDLYETYYGCSNLITIPNISKNVNDMYHTFGACINITGDINILSDKIVNVTNIFGETSARKNVYIPPVCYNDTSINSPTYNSFIAAGYDNIGTKDGVYLMYNYSPALSSDWITSTAANNTIVLEQYIGTNTTVVTPHNDWYSNKILNTSNFTSGPFVKSNVIENVDLVEVEVINNDFSNAFHQCYNLIEVSNLNQNITNLANTFSQCINLYQVPSIPPNVTNLYGTYHTCWNINTPPTIPANVIDMNSTFQACMRLTSIPTIPDSVTNTNLTFGWCTSLTDVNFIANSTINTRQTFAQCIGLQSANATASNSINASYMFDGCNNLTDLNIVIPNATDVTGIFRNCTNITNVHAEFNNVQNLSNLFKDANKLKALTLYAQNTIDASNLCYNCAALNSLALSLSNCENLYCAFNGCYSLTNTPEIPSTAKNLTYTFRFCNNIVDAPIIPDSVTSMSGTFWGCTNLKSCPVLPPNVTTLTQTFQDCKCITDMPIIPSNVSSMGCTFGFCVNLVNIQPLPNSLFGMQDTFEDCYGLVTAPNIPASVGYLRRTFKHCYNLTGNIYIHSNNISDCVNCFINTSLTKNVYIPFEYENGVNTVTRNSFEAEYPVNTISGTTVGTLTDNNGVISGFTNANYLKFPSYFDTTPTDTFEIIFKITTGNLSDDQVIFGNDKRADGGSGNGSGLDLRISSNKLSLRMSSTGASWDIADGIAGISTLTASTTYWIKVTYDGSGHYKVLLSTDNASYTEEITVNYNGQIATRTGCIGIDYHGSGYYQLPFAGSIDLKASTIKLNGEKWWNGYVRPNGVILKDLAGSKITINPTPADATVLMYSEANGKEIDETVLNKFAYTKINDDVEITGLNTTDTAIVVPSIWTKTKSMRVIDGSKVRYKVFKDGYDTVESEIIVDGSETINVTLAQTMCILTIVPFPSDATVLLTTSGYIQSGNSITVPWGTEVSYTVSKEHYTTVTGTEIVKTTGSKYVPLVIDQHTFTINPTPADAAVQILVNGRLVNASSTDWTFTADNLNSDIELQEYIGSNTVVIIPTSYKITNTVTADYGSTIEWKVSKELHKDVTGTQTLTADTTLNINLGDAVDISDYEYTFENTTLTLTKYTGSGGDIGTPLIEEG